MTQAQQLIPPPPVIRERLARTVRDARLLRSLLRLSIQADEQREDGLAPSADSGREAVPA